MMKLIVEGDFCIWLWVRIVLWSTNVQFILAIDWFKDLSVFLLRLGRYLFKLVFFNVLTHAGLQLRECVPICMGWFTCGVRRNCIFLRGNGDERAFTLLGSQCISPGDRYFKARLESVALVLSCSASYAPKKVSLPRCAICSNVVAKYNVKKLQNMP